MPASGAKSAGPPSAPASSAPRPTAPATASSPAASREGTANTPWPREATEGGRTFTVYQPQIEKWDGARLHARAAVSVESAASPLQHFGVVWFSARADVDKVNRLVALADFRVDKVTFPSEPDRAAEYQKVLEQRLPREMSRISLDRIQAALAITEAQRSGGATTQPVKNDPPRVIFSTTPAFLVLVDGKPVFRQVEGVSMSLHRVVNSWALILVDQKARQALPAGGGTVVRGRHPRRAVGGGRTAERRARRRHAERGEKPAGEPPRRPRPRGEGRGGAGRGPDRLRQHGAGRADPDAGPAGLRAHRGHRPPARRELVREHRARPGGPAPLRPPVRAVVPERVPGRRPLGVRPARQAPRRVRQDPRGAPPRARSWPRSRAPRRPRRPSSTTASPRPPR